MRGASEARRGVSWRVGMRWAAGVLVAAALGCGGGTVDEFSATQTTTRGGRTVSTSKVFMAPQMMRVEMPHPSGRGSLVTIMRQDRKLVWMVMPEQRAYRESTLDEAELGAFAQRFKDDQVIEELGKETVAGYSCRKIRVRTRTSLMGRTMESTSTVWQSPKLALPVKSEHESGVVTELSGITPGRQPADLFEVPKDFRKVDSLFPGMLDGGDRRQGRDSSKPSLGDKLKELAKRK